jgi:predicted nucleotidyltransferase/DNA-binding HxlR family transcriptional regulator
MSELHSKSNLEPPSGASVLKYATIVLNMRTSRSKPSTQLVEVLFGAYRRQILGLLLLRPDESFYVREVERVTGVPAGSLHRELKSLTEAGLLVRSKSGNQVRYQADRACPIYEELAGIFRKTAGLADMLRDLLKPLSKKINLAFVFGSLAQGKARPGSDIDLLVVGSVSFSAVVEACHAGTQRLGREVNPVVMTKTAFLAKHRQGDRFISRVAKEPKIFLIGDASEFAKLTEDRPG